MSYGQKRNDTRVRHSPGLRDDSLCGVRIRALGCEDRAKSAIYCREKSTFVSLVRDLPMQACNIADLTAIPGRCRQQLSCLCRLVDDTDKLVEVEAASTTVSDLLEERHLRTCEFPNKHPTEYPLSNVSQLCCVRC